MSWCIAQVLPRCRFQLRIPMKISKLALDLLRIYWKR